MFQFILKLYIRLLSKLVSIASNYYQMHYQDGNLQISYESLLLLPTNLNSKLDNQQGTHLNESGSDHSIDKYIKNFSLELEMKVPSVVDNMFFILNYIAPHLPKNAEIIDIGCGIGKYGEIFKHYSLATQGWSYVGIDRTEEILQFAKILFPEYVFKSSNDSIKIPFPDKSKDLVMASSMLQYTCDQWIQALSEMCRVSRKYIFISRLPILHINQSSYCRQLVIQHKQRKNHYFKLINQQEFEYELHRLGCNIERNSYGTEIIKVEGISEPVVLNQYLIKV